MLERTDRLLGGILIGNTLMIAAASTLSSLVAVRLLGEDKIAYAIGTLVISFPDHRLLRDHAQVIGATHPSETALLLSLPLKVSLRILDPAAWFVNLFVRPLLWRCACAPSRAATRPGSAPRRSARWCSSRRVSCRRSTSRSCSICSTSRR